MIPIIKSSEPEVLSHLRKRAEEKGLAPAQAYATLRGRNKVLVREAILKDQGHLCAYCMCSIPRSDTPEGVSSLTIEHYVPRDPEDHRDVGQGLEYRNLLVTCHGNRAYKGQRRLGDLTCDAHRGNQEFRKINPLIPETLESIRYTLNGDIFSEDEDVNYDLGILLNLNAYHSPLKGERKAVLDELITALSAYLPEEIPDVCSSLLEEFQKETDPKTPYQGILLWYLKSFLEA